MSGSVCVCVCVCLCMLVCGNACVRLCVHVCVYVRARVCVRGNVPAVTSDLMKAPRHRHRGQSASSLMVDCILPCPTAFLSVSDLSLPAFCPV